MYLIYNSKTGKIYREVEIYKQEEDKMVAGFNGQYTLGYHNSTNPAALEVTDEQLAALDQEHFDKYKVVGGAIVEDENWVDPDIDPEMEEVKQQVTDLQLAIVELYEATLSV